MLCSRCQARNSPAALECHHCGLALRDEEDENLDEPRESEISASETKLRRRVWGLAGFAIIAVLVVFAQSGDWLGRRFVEQSEVLPPRGRAALEARYAQWKTAHSQDVMQLMDCYALEALIIREAGQKQTYGDLLQLGKVVRQNGSFDHVTDSQPPNFTFEGDRAVISAIHCYAHSNPKWPPLLGNRVLIWENRSGGWFIIEDRFPRSYTPAR